mmetsp:Transcript_40130/g.94329  ORF Transcript_40130/g.94329 Transcript_40130/m.94329 type:complete len:205 (+) Transcript_40130:331-945(+)
MLLSRVFEKRRHVQAVSRLLRPSTPGSHFGLDASARAHAAAPHVAIPVCRRTRIAQGGCNRAQVGLALPSPVLRHVPTPFETLCLLFTGLDLRLLLGPARLAARENRLPLVCMVCRCNLSRTVLVSLRTSLNREVLDRNTPVWFTIARLLQCVAAGSSERPWHLLSTHFIWRECRSHRRHRRRRAHEALFGRERTRPPLVSLHS